MHCMLARVQPGAHHIFVISSGLLPEPWHIKYYVRGQI